MIIAIAALALASAAGTTTTTPPTTLPTAPTTTSTTTTTTMPSGPTTTIPIPAGYTPLVDDSHTIVIAVPGAWQEVNTAPIMPEEGTAAAEGQPSIVASPDIEKFYTSFDVPGVSFFTQPFVADPITYIDGYGLTTGCTTLEVKEYDDPVFVGYIQVGTDCGPMHMTWNMIVANPIGSSDFTVVVQVQTADAAELETVLRTFNRA